MVRRGISLTEVLIAMGILTVGLLGVASVFPVASWFVQQGDVADRGSAIAQAAFNELLTRGALRPENWLSWHDSAIDHGNATFDPPAIGFTFTRPLAEAMRRSKAGMVANAGLLPQTHAERMSREYGSVFLIDPMGVASVAVHRPDGSLASSNSAWRCGNFPSAPPQLTNAYSPEWVTWAEPNGSRLGIQWPVRRVTLKGFYDGRSNAAMANALFRGGDDLALDLPNARNKPAIQPWRLANLDGSGGANDPVARMARGNYSVMAMVAPTTADARDALATDPSGHSYEVSVIVFYRRPISTLAPRDDAEMTVNRELLQKSERVVRAKVMSTGLGGGELLLEQFGGDSIAESPFGNLKQGRWVMLCGPHPNSTDERPMMTARWYRVLSIDGKNERLAADGDYGATDGIERRLVSLRGPQWPWQPAANMGDSVLSNALYVCIPDGAVAVHSKTVRLEGRSPWATQ